MEDTIFSRYSTVSDAASKARGSIVCDSILCTVNTVEHRTEDTVAAENLQIMHSEPLKHDKESIVPLIALPPKLDAPAMMKVSLTRDKESIALLLATLSIVTPPKLNVPAMTNVSLKRDEESIVPSIATPPKLDAPATTNVSLMCDEESIAPSIAMPPKLDAPATTKVSRTTTKSRCTRQVVRASQTNPVVCHNKTAPVRRKWKAR